MTTAKEPGLSVSWEDLLAAINPQWGFASPNFRRAIDVVTAAHREGEITAEEMEELLAALAAVAVSSQVNAMVDDFFTPDDQGRLGVGRRGSAGPRRSFALI